MDRQRLSYREKLLLGYSPQKSLTNSNFSPKVQSKDSDIDFNDVFGGPPRRVSIQETRYSFTEALHSRGVKEKEEEAILRRRAWSGLGEKPVFGEEGVNRRRAPSHDFYDDIFGGDESVNSTPKKADNRDPFSSAPGSRILSPARPLPPRAEPLGSSPAHAQFRFKKSTHPQLLQVHYSEPGTPLFTREGLSTTLKKGVDFPTFACVPRSPYRNKDGASNGIVYPYSPGAPMSRFSGQAIQGQDESRNDFLPSYRQSPSSHHFSLSREGSTKEKKSKNQVTKGNSKKDSNRSEASTNGSQFHFSIYKWASKGVPLMMPLRAGNRSKLKENNIERSSSSNGRIEGGNTVSKLPKATPGATEFPSLKNKEVTNSESDKMESKKQDNESILRTSTQDNLVAAVAMPESKPANSLQSTVNDVPGNSIKCNTSEETKPHSLPETGFCGKTVEEISVTKKEASKPKMKPLHSLLYGNSDEQDKDEMPRDAGGKESMLKTNKKSSGNVNVVKNLKKQNGKTNSLNSAEVDKASMQGSPINIGDNTRIGIKGKVKEFVKIFNQEAPSKPLTNGDTQNRSSRWKATGTSKAENKASLSSVSTDEKMHMPNVNKKKVSANASIKADEDLKQSDDHYPGINTTIHVFSDTSSRQKDSSSFSRESISDCSKSTLGNADDSFRGNFLIEELSQDPNHLPETGEDHEDFQVSDAKIRQWSSGKEGNIRSLLSTLQYVLWPESGWKPVPLVDIVEGNAVKRAYQKALLCLHPDKLQQKGAAAHQRHIAEKVFDALQEAWTHFNSLGSL